MSRKAPLLKTPALRNVVEQARKKNSVIINSEAHIVNAVSSEVQINNNNNDTTDGKDNKKGGILQRISSKLSKTSDPELPKEDDVIKFKLVEDIRLVTVPITSCLMVLLSYLAFGAILFAHWEVNRVKLNKHVIGLNI